MRFCVKDEIRGRIRVRLDLKRMDFARADSLERYLEQVPGMYKVKVYERTADAAISYREDKKGTVRKDLLRALRNYCPGKADITSGDGRHTGREINKARP